MFGDLLNQGKSGTDRDIADLLNRITGLQSRQTRCTPGKEILDDRFRSISGQLHAENPVDLVLLNRPPSHADDPDPQWQLLQTRSHQELSEFVHDLRQPNLKFLSKSRPPLVERNPVLFWKSLTFILAIMVVALVAVLRFIK